MSHIILYIDDEPEAVNRFKRNTAQSDFIIKSIDFNVITRDDVLLLVEQRDFDFLIVDYTLNEKTGCAFNGDEILSDFIKKFPHFPAILLTNHGEEAIASSESINPEIIHSKGETIEPDIIPTFIARIKKRIEEYKQSITDAEQRAVSLIYKKNSGEELNINEEEELIKLDAFLDDIIGADSSIVPDQMKELSNDNKIAELLNKTDILLEKLQSYEEVS
jgi:DNA-binding NarL/FixJ family response regulator